MCTSRESAAAAGVAAAAAAALSNPMWSPAELASRLARFGRRVCERLPRFRSPPKAGHPKQRGRAPSTEQDIVQLSSALTAVQL